MKENYFAHSPQQESDKDAQIEQGHKSQESLLTVCLERLTAETANNGEVGQSLQMAIQNIFVPELIQKFKDRVAEIYSERGLGDTDIMDKIREAYNQAGNNQPINKAHWLEDLHWTEDKL